MKKINGVALTEKGVVKTAVRNGVVEKAMSIATEVLENEGFVAYPDRKSIALEFVDLNGNKIYATFALTVGTKAPDEKAVKKSSHKAPVAEKITIGD